jgi:hypothetical protein
LAQALSPDQRLSGDLAPEELAGHFFLRPKLAPAAIKPIEPSPSPEPSPVPATPAVEPPAPTADLRFVGEVVIEGSARLALFDVPRQTSFTVSPGETWSDWTCVERTDNALIMRKHEKTYLVYIKK